jgi:L-fuconate dehydratase
LYYHRLIDVPTFLQEELVKSATFRYITDAITPDEALAILKAKEATKKEREALVRSQG